MTIDLTKLNREEIEAEIARHNRELVVLREALAIAKARERAAAAYPAPGRRTHKPGKAVRP